jgi:type VI secretion system protein ImpG
VTFNRYYQDELAFLWEIGREFAQKNPALAELLSERGKDPDVDRLLEGVAFLNARVRERLEEAVPEVVQGLAELMVPQALRPVPATTVVEFTPLPGVLRDRSPLEPGTTLSTAPVEGTPCLFRTTCRLDLLPLTLRDVLLEGGGTQAPALRLRFTAERHAAASVFRPAGLRLFLGGDYPVASTLLLWMARHCAGVLVRGLASGAEVRLPRGCLAFPGLSPDAPLLPWPPLAPPGFRLLQEYFTQPAKLLFVDVLGLDAAAAAADESFEIVFTFDRPPALPGRVSSQDVRLHCAPAVNLFEAESDPWTNGPFPRERLVRAAELPPGHTEVFELLEVKGTTLGSAARVYPSFFSFRHGALPPERQAYYRARRARSPLDDGLDTFLSVLSPADAETISVRFLASNRSLPMQLRPGDVCVPSRETPRFARFRNILPVTPPLRPPLGTELHWRVLAHVGIGQRALAEPAVLRSALGLYNLHAAARHQLGEAHDRRVRSVARVSPSQVTHTLERAVVRGTRIALELEEGGFASAGDAFLFGCALDEIFAHQAPLNSLSELEVKLLPSSVKHRWSPRNGHLSPI